MQIIPADVLCHLDAGLRHVPGLCLNSEHRDLIDGLLYQLKEAAMKLELNTSGYETRDMPFPAFALVEKAAGLDIPMVTGSDAHLPSQVGRHFKRLAEDLNKLSC